ncbi:hypothetical protein [Streptomonospora litoralis]|uniref:Uncharacterized protein n=1 Tax=Streptomonospora litoralis TaxID=2498135 RepID=A0A4P6Q776_9ACTN|nr:hypothetical protein [Streptomonospora litoralis]QBI55281.1 hypothetical protein EKD16_17565 [Streptomonospora litoralis]
MQLSRPQGEPPPTRTGSSAGHPGSPTHSGAANRNAPTNGGATRPERARSWARRGRDAVRAAVLDLAALSGRLAAAWITAGWALDALAGGTRSDLLAGTVLAGAAAFAAGLAAPLSGTALAAAAALAALGPVPLGAAPAPGPVPASDAPWWIALSAVCLLGALAPGRLCADALILHRRRVGRVGARDPEGARNRQMRIGRRPEEAPPLPYPGGRAALGRPSRI